MKQGGTFLFPNNFLLCLEDVEIEMVNIRGGLHIERCSFPLSPLAYRIKLKLLSISETRLLAPAFFHGFLML